MKKPFIKTITTKPLIFNNKINTQLYKHGVYTNRSFNDTNLSHTNLIHQIHKNYLHTNTQILTTNTFTTNHIKLNHHNLKNKLKTINHTNIKITKKITNNTTYITNSINPTNQTPTILTNKKLNKIQHIFSKQTKILTEKRIDLIVLKTFRQLSEIRLAIDAVRQKCDLPIVAQMAFDADFKTGDGTGPERVMMLLKDWKADVVGANCIKDPHVLFDVVTKMVGKDIPIIAQPNAGYPRYVAERLVYMATPDYFGTFTRHFFKTNITIINNCYNTNPEHIKKITGTARIISNDASEIHIIEPRTELSQQKHHQPIPVAERSRLAAKIDHVWHKHVNAPTDQHPALHRDNFVVSVEVNPPKKLDPSKSVLAAKILTKKNVDVVNIADGPRASMRMSN